MSVAAIDEIRTALHRCASALDGGRWGELGELFAADATGDFGSLGGHRDGRDAIVGFSRRALGRFTAVQHLISNVEVTVDGDRAASRCAVHAVHVRDGDAPLLHVGGTYDDRWVRSGRHWAIAQRRLRVVWMTGAEDA